MLENFKRKQYRPNIIQPHLEQFKNYNISQHVEDPNAKSLVASEGSRAHYPPMYSMGDDPNARKPKKIILRKEYSDTIVERGKKSLPIPTPQLVRFDHERRHNAEAAARRSDNTDPLGFERMRVVLNEYGVPMRDVKGAREYDMEGYMNRKTRVKDMRNGIPAATPGDKGFYDADREPGFYKKGGVIAGSTIQLRNSAKPSLKKSSEADIIAERMKRSSKLMTETYEQKSKRLDLEYDLSQVRCLDNSFMKLSQVVPGYEERTGNWLVRPEDEEPDEEEA